MIGGFYVPMYARRPAESTPDFTYTELRNCPAEILFRKRAGTLRYPVIVLPPAAASRRG